ncbi:MAG TPA: hypothetical protein VK616_14905 [Flavitalea sp.]|nr:hypothetical protein [Flavitalea sp.]
MNIKPFILMSVVLFFIVSLCLESGCTQQASHAKKENNRLQKRIQGDPLENLSDNIEVLTYFGERADVSPDNSRIAFMSKTFGDAMVIDVQTRKITCLTCNVPGAAFLRVMHLPTGDYILIGPEHFENISESKKNSDLWYLSKVPGSRSVKIGQKVNEGIAVSKQSMKIAFTEAGAAKMSRLLVADLDISGDSAKLLHRQVVAENHDTTCTLEAQDFYDNDTRMTFFCYVPKGLFEVKGVNLTNKMITNFSRAAGSFNEPEGIFPGNDYTTVESDRQCEWLGGERGSANLDIWKLKLDGTGKDFVRLTHFNDYEGGKAANPVVAANGRFMAFQVAKSTDPPGMGHGLLLYWFGK